MIYIIFSGGRYVDKKDLNLNSKNFRSIQYKAFFLF